MKNAALPNPYFLYGTAWKEEDTSRCVEEALEAGFRAIDTANQRKHYHEAGVGEALRRTYARGQIARKDLFLQTKFTYQRGQDHRLPYDPGAPLSTQVEQSLASSLEHLGTDHVDSFVLHGPSEPRGWSTDDQETWRAMEKLQQEGKARHLGVSNVSSEQLEALCAFARAPVRFVQNRCFARTGWDFRTRALCAEKGITYQGFSLLTANPEIFSDSRFQAITRRIGCKPAQAVFRFAQQIGMLPITGTTDAEHMREDLACAAFELTEAELQVIQAISL